MSIKEIMSNPGLSLGLKKIGDTEYEIKGDERIVISRTIDVIQQEWEFDKLARYIERLKTELKIAEQILLAVNEHIGNTGE